MIDLPWLSPSNTDFPAVDTALDYPDGLLAVGGDLQPDRLIAAYRQGIFPWFEEPEPVLWWTPSPRTVLFPEKVHISRSLNKRLRKNDYRVTYDQAFEAVIQHCADISRPDQQGTWIGEQMIAAYTELYQRGIAHSVEVWRQNELIGGLYGLALGKVFFGESMFSLATDASKIAFVTLAQKLSAAGYALMDCQVSNPHLFTLGAEEIDRQQFMSILRAHVDQRGEAF
jgi:leucyl/phenylalanyl-tRNA--protein transferase